MRLLLGPLAAPLPLSTLPQQHFTSPSTSWTLLTDKSPWLGVTATRDQWAVLGFLWCVHSSLSWIPSSGFRGC